MSHAIPIVELSPSLDTPPVPIGFAVWDDGRVTPVDAGPETGMPISTPLRGPRRHRGVVDAPSTGSAT